MGWVSERYRNIRFRSKMALTYLLIALIPLLFYAFFSATTFVVQSYNNSQTLTEHLTAHVSNSLSVYISTMENLAVQTEYMLLETGVLEQNPSDAQWERDQALLQTQLRHIFDAQYRTMAGIGVAFADDRFVGAGISRYRRDPFVEESWYQKAVESERFALINDSTGRNLVVDSDPSGDHFFTLVKAVADPKTGETAAVIVIDISHSVVEYAIEKTNYNDLLTLMQMQEGKSEGFVFILDEKDNIVYAPVNDIVYRVDPGWLADNKLQDAAGWESVKASLITTIDGNLYQILSGWSEYTGWRAIGVFSLDHVMNNVYYLILLLAICVVFVCAAVTFIALRMSNTITQPISTLRGLMLEAEQGDLSVRFDEVGRADEIGDLGRSFNQMLDQVDHLIQQVYTEQQSKRDAELKSLQEQIKPHFLYNTLDTISWMARDYEARDIVQLVDALTSMFRIGLSQGKDFISLREEITHVSNYLYIQKIRYKEKLNYSVQIDPSLYGLRVPKLILQPLVENAIYHGTKQRRGGGSVQVTGYLRPDGEALILTIYDDGVGIAPNKVKELNGLLRRELQPGEKISFGLFYIAERIRLSYGREYGVSLESVEGRSTTVTVTLPVVFSDQEYMAQASIAERVQNGGDTHV